MSRLIMFFLFSISCMALSAQERVKSPTATIEQTEVIKPEILQFNESEFDFGKIPQGKPVVHIFEFKNTGKTPIVLTNVHASCGCTTPEWSRDSILPGATSYIKVGYNSADEGPFVRSIAVTYDQNTTKELIIKGDVWKTPVNSAPQNLLVNKLNKH